MQLLCASNQLADRPGMLTALRAAGFLVDTVLDLDVGLETITARPYQVAIIGAGARVDGAVRWIRRCRAERLEVTIMLQTDSDRGADRIAALEAGADDCFRLPIPPRELIARLRALVRRPDPAVGTIGGSRPAQTGGDLQHEAKLRELWLFERLAAVRIIGAPGLPL